MVLMGAPILLTMDARAMQRLRSGWPLAGVLLSLLVGVAVAGVGGGSLGGMLSILAFGPAYLIQNSVRRRRGTFRMPPPKSAAEKAQSDARFLRLFAITDLVIAITCVAVVVGRAHWLPGRGGTAVLLLGAALGIASAPYLWGIAELRATQRMLRWTWALAGAFDVVFGAAAATIAITNHRNHWLGGSFWTLALAALALLWLLGAPGVLARARR
jgi:hypothetical protein